MSSQSSLLDDLKTLLGRKLLTSVSINGLQVPASALQQSLFRFSHCLLERNNDPVYEVSLRGTAGGLLFKGKCVLVCTNHQLAITKHESDIGIVIPDLPRFVTSSGVTRYTSTTNVSDATDLAAFDFTEQSEFYPSLKSRFFSTASILQAEANERAELLFAFGYAFEDQKYDLADASHLGTVVRCMVGSPGPNSKDQSVGTIKFSKPMVFKPDGFSGGPVFALVLEGRSFKIKFAGITSRAGGDLLYFIRAEAVLSLLERHIK